MEQEAARLGPVAMTEVRGELGFTDARDFGLFDYRHGHSYALLRGFPTIEEIEESEGGAQFRLLDVCFAGVDRISCWRNTGPIYLRRATDQERAVLEERIGPIRYATVFLLKPDSIEHYVIASRVYWAEFDLGG